MVKKQLLEDAAEWEVNYDGPEDRWGRHTTMRSSSISKQLGWGFIEGSMGSAEELGGTSTAG